MLFYGITKKDIDISKNITPYIRILGFNDIGKKLISMINASFNLKEDSISSFKKNDCKLEIITSVKKFEDSCTNKKLKLMLEKDILATNIYNLATHQVANQDYTNKLQTL